MTEVNGTALNGTLLNGTHVTNDWPYHSNPEFEVPGMEEQRARLEADIASARARTATARHRAALRDVDVRAALRTELDASRQALAAMEHEYETMMATVREGARIEVERIVAEARLRAAGSVEGGAGHVE